MKTTVLSVNVSIMLLVAGGMVGCGGKEDSIAVAPPAPPDSSAGVSLAEPAPAATTAPTEGAPGAPGTATTPANLPPPTTEEGLKAITKGMTEQQIKEFKETASFETHDTQIAIISEAANTYYNEFQRAPANVEALVKAGHLSRVLQAPKGKKYVIDQKTLEVTAVNQ